MATETNLGIEISVPVVLPDGDLVSITVVQEGGLYLVHDSSSAVTLLASLGTKMNPEHRKKFIPLASRFGCEVANDRIQRRVERHQIGGAVIMVANAARAVADLALEMKRRVERDFKTAVTDALSEIAGNRLRINQEVKGASGRSYHVQNIVLDAAMRHPLAYIESLATRAAVSAHFTEFFDLQAEKPEDLNFVSVFDGNSDIRETDTRLLEKVGSVISLAQAGIHVRRLVGQQR